MADDRPTSKWRADWQARAGLRALYRRIFQKAPANEPSAGISYHTIGCGLAQPFVLERGLSHS